MGIKIATDGRPIKVWRMDTISFPVYSISVSKKEGDHWISSYQQVKFKKGVNLKDGTCIHIHNAFPSVESWVKDDKQYSKIVWWITDFEIAGMSKQNEEAVQKTAQDNHEGWENVK